ncbi:MarR family transcriptional regulator [Cryobacterium adonitolivorans]|uniref:MarR family transcriptional regulator n=1 Tax=Cryobacterium adonitolivorans TaxID=1259189 RepID=A0A4R8W5W0_9MICO|nr:MarR family transcriptional regulator [Cryobacterium adonitolivorans]TFC02379.1 MarR family transcriptional regulator [Cryobacterium adonitolivorans]
MSADLHVILGDLVSVNHRLTRVAARAARGTESPALWRTLSVLRSTGPIRLGELADLSRVSQPTATKLAGGLVARGWIERTNDPDDARVSLIASTPAGEAALAAWRAELAAALLPYFADLSAGDVETLERAVAILRDRVEATERMAAPHRLAAEPTVTAR